MSGILVESKIARNERNLGGIKKMLILQHLRLQKNAMEPRNLSYPMQKRKLLNFEYTILYVHCGGYEFQYFSGLLPFFVPLKFRSPIAFCSAHIQLISCIVI